MTDVEISPGVCGGEPRIARTRIPVWVLEQMRRSGATNADILTAYPALRVEDLSAAWNYADRNRDAIDTQIRDNEVA
ncbi:MAG TPA: DUF433 domain-containing protein [Pirellulales bacterium]|jgi:uncharacterized protein (DUF433 family)|nr:DUF433 domain-containing protein [Pirellulales bacterium]